jgi:hypothetical protein
MAVEMEPRPAPLEPDVVAALAEVGIYSPDPTDELHRRLVDALRRTRGEPDGIRFTAMRWVYSWALEQAGDEFATAKSEYEAKVAKAVIRFRDAGERSGEMCTKRAEATDEVQQANLRYRVAEQRERLARKRLDTMADQIKVWQSVNADRRAADQFHARTA